MAKFRVEHIEENSPAGHILVKPPDDVVIRHIRRNNPEGEIIVYRDLNERVIIVCDNQPKNMLVYGISFKPYEEN